ncbi:alpha/beta hydrolase [Aquimarina agarivorans]|uniref:alpha/beta hydrolase n=1 Tax=Aquimarina agarivorans TaxID=980584 RepID=UPI000248EAE8|nr:alpha/beta hydrolase-fold protein [Aquimarina agarivorans]
MKSLLITLALCIFFGTISAQTVTKNIKSLHLDTSREVKIRLPKSYKKDPNKEYLLIVTLDGDYLFDPMVGNVKYFSYWEDMPEAIVVGIKQSKTRKEDCRYDSNTYLPEYEGRKFYDFVATELVPFMENNYRLAKFKIIAGHDYTGNFINYFMKTDKSAFQAYINLSPEFAPTMSDRVVDILTATENKMWYYMATATNDVKSLREDIILVNDKLSTIENENVRYKFDDFEDASHYSLVALGIPRALEDIFSIYRPISKKEYKENIANLETSPYDYLIEKYEIIKSLLGVEKRIRVNDFIAISTALEKKEDWEELEKLGKLARNVYPAHMLGNYYLGTAYENKGEPKKAMRAYQNGFLLEEISFLSKDIMLEKAERIKQDFGY